MQVQYKDTFDCEFINKIIAYLWKNVDLAIADTIRQTCEPIFESSRPAFITELAFTSFSLGDVSPFISGVRVEEDKAHRGKIIIYLKKVHFNLKPNINFKIALTGVPLHIRLDTVIVSAYVRVELANLVPSFPCFSKIGVSFMEPPHIDYRYIMLLIVSFQCIICSGD